MALHLTKRQKWAYLASLLLAPVVVGILLHPDNASLHTHGPMNTGHENLKCNACHKPAPGTLRQRLQINARYLIGLEDLVIPLGNLKVDNQACMQCHQRPNDRHPVYRFNEPKYTKLRQTLGPHQCNSCHKEHSGKRITSNNTFCNHCHDELKLKNDPLDTSHHILVQQKKWSSCLGCHDYHGNHKRDVPTKLAQKITDTKINNYFATGESPYSKHKIYATKHLKEYED